MSDEAAQPPSSAAAAAAAPAAAATGQPKGASNFKRRTWDKEFFAQKAKERAERGDGDADDDGARKLVASSKEEFQAAPEGAAGPAGSERAFLSGRTARVDLDQDAGKIQRLRKTGGAGGVATRDGGYYCEVCECILRDSVAYLDHINGKKHNRNLGFSMRVATSSVSQVASRLGSRKRGAEEMRAASAASAAATAACGGSAADAAAAAYEARLAAREEEEQAAKRAKKEAAREAKAAAKAEAEAAEAAAAEEAGAGMDPDMMAMMGFGGFGGSKK